MEFTKSFDEMFEQSVDDMIADDNRYDWINPVADRILAKYNVTTPNGMYFMCRGFLMACQFFMDRL